MGRFYTKSSAVISPCGKYRYVLEREWHADDPYCTFIMLNPSKATGEIDDPTIRRCVGFADSVGCGGLAVVNLFSLRATNPRDLTSTDQPVGPETDDYLVKWAEKSRLLVAAWGQHGQLYGRAKAVLALLRPLKVPIFSLGLTKDGYPKHPLYLPSGTPMVPFTEC